MCSVPMERRTVLGRMPLARSSSPESWEGVEAGVKWPGTFDASATLATGRTAAGSVNLRAAAAALISKVKMDAAPLGKYFFYKSSAWPVQARGSTRSTWGGT